MTDSGGFDVSPDEIAAHATKVQATADLLETALDAAHNRMASESWGLFGIPLSWVCNDVMESATNALSEARAAGDRHAAAVHDWAKSHRVNEESITALFRGNQ
ncbi:type VII secretion target [Actinokineospora iranica]|uniref:Excreted virulence factor EspC, type VII ESX diderm n=1 Tax=Actinokineospora iranica TaxID=1271860 RepID=A0A1G6LYW9_9PSEU|nr:type VII secretion target [Actinokineospora iranica]SDC48463.1 Excreted virulence factor EspC, type VII ESX diderm [Actinokineospora iranica]